MTPKNIIYHDELNNPSSEKGGTKTNADFEQRKKGIYSNDDPIPGNMRKKRT